MQKNWRYWVNRTAAFILLFSSIAYFMLESEEATPMELTAIIFMGLSSLWIGIDLFFFTERWW